MVRKEEGRKKVKRRGRKEEGEMWGRREMEREISEKGSLHCAIVFVKGTSGATYIPYHRWYPSVHQLKETAEKQ